MPIFGLLSAESTPDGDRFRFAAALSLSVLDSATEATLARNCADGRPRDLRMSRARVGLFGVGTGGLESPCGVAGGDCMLADTALGTFSWSGCGVEELRCGSKGTCIGAARFIGEGTAERLSPRFERNLLADVPFAADVEDPGTWIGVVPGGTDPVTVLLRLAASVLPACVVALLAGADVVEVVPRVRNASLYILAKISRIEGPFSS